MKIYEGFARVYWKLNRIKLKIFADRQMKHWRKRKTEIIDNCAYGYIKNVSDLNLKIDKNSYKRIGRIDQRGRVLSEYNIVARTRVGQDKFIKRNKNDIDIVSINGKIGIKKDYRGNKEGFIKELRGLYYANLARANVPAIIDINFDELYIIFSYIMGLPLRDVKRKSDISYVENGLIRQVKKMHKSGVLLNDLTPNNIIIESGGEPFIIDFEMSATKADLGIFYDYFIEVEKKMIQDAFR